MGSQESAEWFHYICLNLGLCLNIVQNFFSAILSVIAIKNRRQTQGWHNLALLLLLVNLLTYTTATFIRNFGLFFCKDKSIQLFGKLCVMQQIILPLDYYGDIYSSIVWNQDVFKQGCKEKFEYESIPTSSLPLSWLKSTASGAALLLQKLEYHSWFC